MLFVGLRDTAGEELTSRFGPSGGECFEELENGGTLEANRCVPPSGAGPAFPKPLVVEAKPARPSYFGVDRDAANVRPILDYPQVTESQRPERYYLRARFPYPPGVVAAKRLGAERIVEDEDEN